MYLYEQLEASPAEFVLAHPKQLKAIATARLKNDKVDSEMLATLLRADLIPPAYVPRRAVRDLRELLRMRAALVQTRSVVKIRLRSILLKTGYDCPDANILGKKSQAFCRSLELRECYRLGLDHWLRVGAQLNLQLKEVDRELAERVEKNSEAALLMSMPGLGLYSALLILAEIGEIGRFKYSDQLVSYAGLAPRVKKSANHTKRGSITKEGSKYLRWILIEVAPHAIRKSKRFRRKYQGIVKRRGAHKARVAVAALMLRCIHWMLTHQESFKDA